MPNFPARGLGLPFPRGLSLYYPDILYTLLSLFLSFTSLTLPLTHQMRQIVMVCAPHWPFCRVSLPSPLPYTPSWPLFYLSPGAYSLASRMLFLLPSPLLPDSSGLFFPSLTWYSRPMSICDNRLVLYYHLESVCILSCEAL